MKYSILLVLLLIVSLNAPAQMFSGRVLDDQKIPVQYATVALLSVFRGLCPLSSVIS